MKKSNYDKYPHIEISANNNEVCEGWIAINEKINQTIKQSVKGKSIIVIECYQGIDRDELKSSLQNGLQHAKWVDVESAWKAEKEIIDMVYPFVTDDAIFGYMTSLTMSDYFDSEKLSTLRSEVDQVEQGVIVLFGHGASLVSKQIDLLVYADMARWEIQLRMRKNQVTNLGIQNSKASFSEQYKRGYFVDWRVCDLLKRELMNRWDFVLDTNKKGSPKMIEGKLLLSALTAAANRPFRVVPFFDPGPWGGQWLKKNFELDPSAVNYAWGFDCVPEENSLLIKCNDIVIEVPSINVVFHEPTSLLGEKVFNQFGAEFPIRFDFLDTIEGGNLSLQVHPLTSYIKEKFGMDYTQDESYYMLDALPGAFVYLGLRDDVNPENMVAELNEAQKLGGRFDAEKHVAKWPLKKHDHFSIPAGTVHCSGANALVLEISATPYIFTFKLWDWDRLGLDGKPRPINIAHGEKNIRWERNATWVEKNRLNLLDVLQEEEGIREERTGLHESEFIETRRHWFTKTVSHHTKGGVNVLNLVSGDEAIVESPTAAFKPFVVHYAETFIIPAAVGEYTIRPYGESLGKECATIKAYIR